MPRPIAVDDDPLLGRDEPGPITAGAHQGCCRKRQQLLAIIGTVLVLLLDRLAADATETTIFDSFFFFFAATAGFGATASAGALAAADTRAITSSSFTILQLGKLFAVLYFLLASTGRPSSSLSPANKCVVRLLTLPVTRPPCCFMKSTMASLSNDSRTPVMTKVSLSKQSCGPLGKDFAPVWETGEAAWLAPPAA